MVSWDNATKAAFKCMVLFTEGYLYNLAEAEMTDGVETTTFKAPLVLALARTMIAKEVSE